MAPPFAPPILTCAEALAFEQELFGGDEAKEWPAMQAAGRAVAAGVLADFQEIGGFPAGGRILVLAGKGHNAGDALLATRQLLEAYPSARAEVIFAFGDRGLRPLTARAWRELAHFAGGRVSMGSAGGGTGVPPVNESNHGRDAHATAYDLCLGGVFGLQFRPPLDPVTARLLAWANALPIRLRAAVDLPSGLDAPDAFRADFTYATGSVKTPLLTLPNAGRVRYLDLGFFLDDPATCNVIRDKPEAEAPGSATPATLTNRVLTDAVLAPLRRLRDPHTDKRTYGHLLVLGGSRHYPGAVLMSVLAALRGGTGLVTAFVPESLAAAFAARAPEAMWVGWPETAAGGLALAGLDRWREQVKRATAAVIGPGLGREPETVALVTEILQTATLPVLLDADALQPAIVRAGRGPRVLTPHAGEFQRIAGSAELTAYAAETRATVVLKGPVTRISDGRTTWHSFFGGPVLARGGSGDVLAGLIGGQLAQAPDDRPGAAARGVVWHGHAADLLARAHGQAAVTTTQLLEFLPEVLRETAPPARPPGQP
jgi:NAD(P)H-hydrate epimerase